MAVVLPIHHNHLDFSTPARDDYDYERQCQETLKNHEEKQQQQEEEEESDEESSEDSDGLNDENSMDIIGVNHDRDDGSSTSTSTMQEGNNNTESRNNGIGIGNGNGDSDSDADSDSVSHHNDWTMKSENNNDNNNDGAKSHADESSSSDNDNDNGVAVDENAAFITSLMAVDIASTNDNDIDSTANNEGKSEDLTESDTSSAVDIMNTVNMYENKNENESSGDQQEEEIGLPSLTTSEATELEMEIDSDDDELPELEEVTTITETITADDDSPYGGLVNLGNTCYMASALQLLCGLDSFPAELKARIPPSNSDDDDDNDDDDDDDANNKDADADADSQSQSQQQQLPTLRDALIDVMGRLAKGETVRPDSLKRCIDSRTGLFLGYRQQDSHEFVTTLLDIIDEDYKVKPPKPIPNPKVVLVEPSKEEQPTNDEKQSSDNDDTGDDDDDDQDSKSNIDDLESKGDKGNAFDEEMNNDETNEKKPSSSCNDDTNKNKNTELVNNDDDISDSDQQLLPVESALKRQKLILEDQHQKITELEQTITNMVTDTKSNTTKFPDTGLIQRSKSFSEFMFSDIESLLHDEEKSSTAAAAATTVRRRASSSSPSPTTKTKTSKQVQEEPKCKLAGGRMNAVGVELTRFVEGGDIDENVQPTDASLNKTTPQQQIIENEDHGMQENEEGEEKNDESVSPVASNFTTKVRVCLTCESCKFRRSHIETYFHLSLDISTDDSGDECSSSSSSIISSSIEDGLRKFFAPEKRDIKCEKCFHTSALQTSEITQLPRNLLFHLKRFIVDISPDYSSISYKKDQSSVSFEERMELEVNDDDDDGEDDGQGHGHGHGYHDDDEEGGFQKFLALDCSYKKGAAYEIRSVVNHIGSSASCGHYTADAKRKRRCVNDNAEQNEREGDDNDNDNGTREGDEGDRQWTRFNDSYVSKISSKEAVQDASKTAYMIMYELVEG